MTQRKAKGRRPSPSFSAQKVVAMPNAKETKSALSAHQTQITIGTTTYPLRYGFAFLRKLDEIYTYQSGELEFGYGVGMLLVYLSQFNPLAILYFLQAATCTEDEPPTEEAIEKAMETWDLVEMAENFIDALSKSPLTRQQIAAFARLGEAQRTKNLNA